MGCRSSRSWARWRSSFGKFDWRLPEPHAIYWATLAKIVEPIRNQSRQINYDRLLMYSLQATMRRGLISYLGPDPNSPLVTAFDLSKIKPIDDALQRQCWRKTPRAIRSIRNIRGADSVRDGHVQFLQEPEFNLYFAGFVNEAQKYHMELYKLYDKPDPYEDLEHVCVGKVEKLVDEYGTMDKVRAFVDDLVVKACFDLCMNKAIEAHQQENLARRAWEAYCTYTEAQQEGKNPRGQRGASDLERSAERGCQPGPSRPLHRLSPVRSSRSFATSSKFPQGAEVDKLNVGEAITPEIPPSSPPPK